MRHYDLSPLYKTAIGFDRLDNLLNDVQRKSVEVNYPPYNIELISDDEYRIVMAVAGFELSELEIETEQQAVKVVGKKVDKAEKSYLHRGIATRDFEHKFQLADHVKVVDANLENGLLLIDLVREVPEALKPRKVAIGSKQEPGFFEAKKAA